MIMRSIINNNKYLILALGILSFAFSTSCVVPDVTEGFPAVLSATCDDGILNQGEYEVDCGGPCPACITGDPFISVIIDSTWFEDSSKTSARNWTPKELYFNYSLDTNYVWVSAWGSYPYPDTNIGHQLQFRIPKNVGRGVHEIPITDPGEYYFSNPLGGNYIGEKVVFERGVITITNKDDVNGLITGEFEYICAPGTGELRTVLTDGKFEDVPLK